MNTASTTASTAATSNLNYHEQYQYNYRQIQILQKGREILVTNLLNVLACKPDEILVLKSVPPPQAAGTTVNGWISMGI